MDSVREVYGRSPLGQVFHLPFGGEDEDLILEDIRLDGLHELLRLGDLTLPLQKLAQPGQALLVAQISLAALLVAPVGGHSVFSGVVHLIGANLHLQGPRVQAEDSGVEGLVHALLGVGDVIVEGARQRPPQPVDDAQGAVAVGDGIHQDPNRQQVIDLVGAPSGGGVLFHLLVDAVDVLGAPLDIGLDVLLGQLPV